MKLQVRACFRASTAGRRASQIHLRHVGRRGGEAVAPATSGPSAGEAGLGLHRNSWARRPGDTERNRYKAVSGPDARLERDVGGPEPRPTPAAGRAHVHTLALTPPP